MSLRLRRNRHRYNRDIGFLIDHGNQSHVNGAVSGILISLSFYFFTIELRISTKAKKSKVYTYGTSYFNIKNSSLVFRKSSYKSFGLYYVPSFKSSLIVGYGLGTLTVLISDKPYVKGEKVYSKVYKETFRNMMENEWNI